MKFDQDLCATCDMNSTPGSVVPLAMFLTNVREKITGSGHGFISTLQLCLQGEDNLNCRPKFIFVIIFCRIWTPRDR